MWRRYQHSTFLRGFFALFSGSAIAQLIPLGLAPFISRFYSVEDVALYGLFFSLVSVFSVVAGGRYEMAIVLPKTDTESTRLVHVTFLISFLSAAFSLVFVLVFKNFIGNWLNNQNIVEWLWLLPPVIFLVGCFQAINIWLIRKKRFKDSAWNKVLQRLAEGVGILGFGLAGMGFGLIVSDFFGRLAMLLIGLKQTIKQGFLEVQWDLKANKVLMNAYKDYPLHFSLSSLANAAAMQMPLLFISNGYSVLIVGLFNLMKQVLSTPIAFISRNISSVFLERLSEKWRNNQPIRTDLIKLTLLLMAIASSFVLPLLLFGEELFSLIFGEKWRIAGKFAQIMCISFALRFVVSPLSSLLNAINKISIASYWQWSYFLAMLLLLPMLRFDLSIERYLLIYCSLETLLYIIYWFLIYKQAVNHDRTLLEQ